MREERSAMDVVLVHGAYHGAWCWDLLAPELERRGHRVTAVDLPISDPAAGANAYADVVERATAGSREPVIVGHSMAGLVIPLVAARRAVRRLVFLAAFLPLPGASVNEQRQAEPIDGRVPPTTAEWEPLGDDVWRIGPTTATELFFHDAPPDLAAWAVERLRPQAYRAMSEPSPLVAWPDVESASIICRDDRAMNPDWGRTAARGRLGIEAIEVDGGHSPFLTRPVELAGILDTILG
jgi:pimeloyl-ACP methyl ester carboxylesterase